MYAFNGGVGVGDNYSAVLLVVLLGVEEVLLLLSQRHHARDL